MADVLLRYRRPMATGAAVRDLQQLLKTHGVAVTVDGMFGPKTRDAVKAFQKAKKLKQDGIVGPLTWAELRKPPFAGTPHFKAAEFRCKCGGKYCDGYKDGVPTGVVPDLLVLLEAIRAEANRRHGKGKEFGLRVHSGYRCPKYNRAVGGASRSRHVEADAADISMSCCTPYELGLICDELNPRGGVGLGGLNIVHVDTRPGKSRWWYTYKNWDSWKKRFF